MIERDPSTRLRMTSDKTKTWFKRSLRRGRDDGLVEGDDDEQKDPCGGFPVGFSCITDDEWRKAICTIYLYGLKMV